MKKVILLTILLFSSPVFADQIADKIDDLIEKTNPSVNIGIKIRSKNIFYIIR